MACHALTHEISGHIHNSLLVWPMKDSQSWSHVSTRTTDGNYLRKFCQSIHKKRREGNEEKMKKLKWQLQSFSRYKQTAQKTN